jgi:hypothetical protein
VLPRVDLEPDQPEQVPKQPHTALSLWMAMVFSAVTKPVQNAS